MVATRVRRREHSEVNGCFRMAFGFALVVGVMVGALGHTGHAAAAIPSIRLGYFPNITHAPALVGVVSGDFQRGLGDTVKLESKAFNGGPSLVEALFAKEIDIGYVGPNPALNAYVKSRGQAVRVIAGATSGGAALVVRKGSGIVKAGDLAGRRVATPQLGNTQDVALRKYLGLNGLMTKTKGGTVEVLTMENAVILNSFARGEIHAAWVPEPWVTRLITEANGAILIDERDLWPDRKFATAVVIVRKGYLEAHPDLVEKFLSAHLDALARLTHSPEATLPLLSQAIEKITSKRIPLPVFTQAFTRLEPSYDPLLATLRESANSAYALGFLGRTKPDLSGIADLTILNKLLKARNLPPVGGPAN